MHYLVWVMVYVLKVFLQILLLDTVSNQTEHMLQGISVNILVQSVLSSVLGVPQAVGHLLSPFLDTTFDRDSGWSGRQLPESLGALGIDLCSEVCLEPHTSCIKLSITNYLRA